MSAPRWLDKPRNVTRLVYVLYAICAVLVAAELVVHRHAHFTFEAWFGFYAIFGFGAYCVIVLSARALRRMVRRDENYYGEAERDGD